MEMKMIPTPVSPRSSCPDTKPPPPTPPLPHRVTPNPNPPRSSHPNLSPSQIEASLRKKEKNQKKQKARSVDVEDEKNLNRSKTQMGFIDLWVLFQEEESIGVGIFLYGFSLRRSWEMKVLGLEMEVLGTREREKGGRKGRRKRRGFKNFWDYLLEIWVLECRWMFAGGRWISPVFFIRW